MNLVKKLSLIAIMILLFTLPARAEVLTDECVTDDFNHTMSTETSRGKYPRSPYLSDIFVQTPGYADASNSTITKGAGPDGSTALVFHKRGDERSLCTKPLEIGSSADGNKIYELSYDIKFSSNQYAISLGGRGGRTAVKSTFSLSSGGYIKTTTDGSTYTDAITYSPDTWYHVVILLQGSSKQGWIYDDNGNYAYSSLTDETGTSIDAICMGSATSGAIELTIDNAKLVVYNAATQTPDILESTVTNDEENVPRNIALTFVFDQKIADTSTVTFTKGEEGTEPVDGAQCTIKRYTNTVVVTYPGLLERDTQYTLSFSSVTNGTLSATDTITFRTEDLHPLNDVVISAAEPNSEDSTKTDITFSFGDPLNYPTFTGAALAVVYKDGAMVSANMVSLSALPMGETTQAFSLGTLPSGAEIKLILLDTVAHPIPLAGGILAN